MAPVGEPPSRSLVLALGLSLRLPFSCRTLLRLLYAALTIVRGKVPPSTAQFLAKSRAGARTVARRVLQFEQVNILHWTRIRARPVVTLEGLECWSFPLVPSARRPLRQSERDGECDARSRSPGPMPAPVLLGLAANRSRVYNPLAYGERISLLALKAPGDHRGSITP